MMWVSLQFSGGDGPGFKEFFFNGNQTHSEIVTSLKQNLLTIAKGPKVPPIYCLHEACTNQKVQVYLSKQTYFIVQNQNRTLQIA